MGDGRLVRIENIPWLSSTENPFVMTESESIKGQIVSALMVPKERQWDADSIKDIFIEPNVNLILATPLSNGNIDSWYWIKEKCGNYSIKTSYILLQESKHPPNQIGNNSFWRRLRNLTVPPNIKTFMWHGVTECLPTKDMLRMKQVDVNVVCALYNNEVETVNHLMLECSFAKSCWGMVGTRNNNTTQVSFSDWAFNDYNV